MGLNPQHIQQFGLNINSTGNLNLALLCRAAKVTICASHGQYTSADSELIYIERLTLTDTALWFTNPRCTWTTNPLRLTSGNKRKSSADILALPMCLWVINHQFMNHRCAAESESELCEEDLCSWNLRSTDVPLKLHNLNGALSFHVCTGRRCGQHQDDFSPQVTPFVTRYSIKVKGKDKQGVWRPEQNLQTKFHKEG